MEVPLAKTSLCFATIASGLGPVGMPKPRKSQDEKQLENLAKKLLSMPHKPREESKIGKTPGKTTRKTQSKNERQKTN
jgi:hypothetical protein